MLESTVTADDASSVETRQLALSTGAADLDGWCIGPVLTGGRGLAGIGRPDRRRTRRLVVRSRGYLTQTF